MELGVTEVVVKDGANPARIGFEGKTLAVAATPGDVVDATGAGDSFNGAYLAARLEGATPAEAAAAGHRVAAVVIGHRGALVDPELVR
jgi:2-dehydro-3-deoxygluconokinase